MCGHQSQCPHIFKYMNCKGDHQVDSYSCSYWRNCFNRSWHDRKSQELFQKQSMVTQQFCQQLPQVFFSFLFLFLFSLSLSQFLCCLPINVMQLLSSYRGLPLCPRYKLLIKKKKSRIPHDHIPWNILTFCINSDRLESSSIQTRYNQQPKSNKNSVEFSLYIPHF